AEILGDFFGGDRRAPFASDGRGDAFLNLVFRETVLQQSAAGLVHHVNPAGGNVFTRSVNLAPTAAAYHADAHELSVADRDIGHDRRIARAIEDAPVTDHDVVDGRGVRLRPDRGRRD